MQCIISLRGLTPSLIFVNRASSLTFQAQTTKKLYNHHHRFVCGSSALSTVNSTRSFASYNFGQSDIEMNSAKRSKMSSSSNAKFVAATPASDTEFEELEKQLKQFDEKRETVIKRSRDIQKAAKQAIYALQRNDIEKANDFLKICEGQQDLLELVKGEPDLRYGSFANSLEEYAEAVIFREYVSKKESATPLSIKGIPLPLTADEYLGGLMDCCGEVQRYAIFSAARGNIVEVERAREYVDYVMGRMMQFEFRNGSLRKKSDTIKWVLKRLEDVLFDISVSGRLRPDEPVVPATATTEEDGQNA